MKRALLLLLIATLSANCARRTNKAQANTNAIQSATPNAQPTAESAKPSQADSDEPASAEPETEVPAEFKNVDFKNFTYPASFERGRVPLRDGTYEYPRSEGGGGDTFDLEDVSFVDLTGDGKKEAIVRLLWVSCGGSCDGGSHLFYVYSGRKNKPVLFWRIETGSTGYGCGLKSFVVNERKINLELFNNCRYKGATPVSMPTEGEFGKFSALAYTRFLFGSDGKQIALKRREILAYPQGSAKNYQPEIKISND